MWTINEVESDPVSIPFSDGWVIGTEKNTVKMLVGDGEFSLNRPIEETRLISMMQSKMET